jgi:hypothetical protein
MLTNFDLVFNLIIKNKNKTAPAKKLSQVLFYSCCVFEKLTLSQWPRSVQSFFKTGSEEKA